MHSSRHQDITVLGALLLTVRFLLELAVLAAAAGALVAIQERTAAEVLAVTAVVNGAALYALGL